MLCIIALKSQSLIIFKCCRKIANLQLGHKKHYSENINGLQESTPEPAGQPNPVRFQIITTSNYRRSNKHDLHSRFQNLRPTIPNNCPPAMRALIEQCWSSHPEKRPDFGQLVKVIEEFETLVAREGNLDLLQYPTCLDHKKGLRHWIQKLSSHHHA
ncbi:putative protein kinase TKL-Pl-4 family [Helianthus annuus]|uniref:Serine-threonine/tyrosine-protein kinase catalytic domain-containing protein n=1 Tax=Helianthus annuus TaxID=4232 RepID=A0A9K3DPW1_HELAN|nr:putative protein kinase TKL-Pl-4 family [Helianthus annuus]